ncbi:MAG: hypothetical protein R8F63_01110 [Acidimicrobiales bacterium]|nr:hypothetical protein [Acidimicrobiales bacterium]
MIRRRARWSCVIVTFVVFAAACGDDDGSAGDTTTDTAPISTSTSEPAATSTTVPPLTASFRGVSEDTIELGIAGVDFNQLLDLGFIDFNHGDEIAIWDALIAAVNDDGGIHGRRLTAIHDSYLPVGNVEAEESCLYFTEDNEVFAVLGLWIGDSVLCLTETHQTIHVGHLMRQEWIDRSIATLASPDMAEERELQVLLDVLLLTDRLDGRTIGVLTNTSAASSVDTVVRPFVEANELDLGTVGVITDTQGDQIAVDREILRFTENWKLDGVDFVLVVGTSGVGSIADIRDVMGDIDVAVLDAETFQQIFGAATEAERDGFDGVLTVAGLSSTNTEQFEEPLLQECITTVEEAVPGLTVVPTAELVGPEDWFAGIRDACSSLAVFVAAATAAGTDLTNETFEAGLESLGSIDLPGQAFSSFGPGKHDGEDGFRLVAFDPHDGEEGSFIPLTEIVNTAEG